MRDRRVRARLAGALLSVSLAALWACSTTPRDSAGNPASPPGQPGRYALIDGKVTAPPDIPMGSPRTIERVIDEGARRSQVMQHVTYLSEQIGARLTGSTAAHRACEWARDRFASWGLDARLEPWTELPVRWDRGEQWGRVLIKSERVNRGRGDDRENPSAPRPLAERAAKAPLPEGYRMLRPLEFTTQAWTAGTDGPRRGAVVRMPRSEDEYNAVKDKLAGAWILVPRVPLSESPGVDFRRGGGSRARWEQKLDARKKAAEGQAPAAFPIEQRILFDGIHGFISASTDDRVWTSGAPGWRTRDAADIPPDVEVVVRLSDYDYINSRLQDGDPIEVEFDLPVTITPGPVTAYNVVADIKGTEKPDEVVVVCAHLDSWNGPGSQGTVDNGTGSSVTLEAARLLMAAGARPKRTIRFILWTGEEQGLLGARAYVKQQEANWDKFSACFNDDGGTNHQGGLPVIEDMVPYLAAATAPVNGRFFSKVDGKWLDVNLRVTEKFTQIAASDHYAFVEKGIPGFFWDEVGRANYWYGWHTQNDRLDQTIEEYLVQSAVCSAVTAYNLASAPGLLPRWPMEQGTETAPITPNGRGPGQPPQR